MLLLNCKSISKEYSPRKLFEGVSLTFHDDDRVGLIGPNGAGKTTLLRILAGVEEPDAGEVLRAKNLKLAYVAQENSFPAGATVESVLADACVDEDLPPHERLTRARVQMGKLGFEDGAQKVATLSGGWRKRLAIGAQLIRQPEMLLLDEPTNHLDLRGILWLESLLAQSSFAFVMVTHDRYFLERVTSRVVEINPRYPEGFFSNPGGYSDFLEKRQAWFETQQRQERSLAAQVRREVEWLRAGVMARGTKARGRIKDAHDKISKLAKVRRHLAEDRSITMDFNGTERRSKGLLEGHKLEKSLGGHQLFTNLDLELQPGTRLGIVGNNGSGKTTLLRILSGDLAPDAGRIKEIRFLQKTVFGQEREQLDGNLSLRRALAPTGGDMVVFRGKETHVASWAQRFLFRTEQLDNAVSELSGGEQARVLIANLMLQPCDVMFLDEPTNDLDIDSIEALESQLMEFPGAIVLISHDRFLLDRVCTSLVGLHGDGECGLYGSVAQFLDIEAQKDQEKRQAVAAAKSKAKASTGESSKAPRPQKLSYNEQRELERIETDLAATEEELERLKKRLEDPEITADHRLLHEHCLIMDEAQKKLDALYERWHELSERA